MDSMENAVLVGDTVIIQTCGRLNWADGKKAKVEKVDFIDKELVVQLKVDWLDPNKPPFGKIDLYGYEVQRITDDNVNHPSHYTDGKYECIDYMESKGYINNGYIFNAVKYISRAGKKDPDKYEEDIQKAIWYLKRKKEYVARDRIPRIKTEEYIEDKGLEGSLLGIALELIDSGESDLAAKVLEMELNSHKKHSS